MITDYRTITNLFNFIWVVVALWLMFATAYYMKESHGFQQQTEAYVNAIEDLQTQDTLPTRQDTVIEFSNEHDISYALSDAVVSAADSAGVPRPIAARLVAVESSYRPFAASHKGAIGLTQVKPSTARLYGEDITAGDLYDVETNLRIGFNYLRDLYERFGSWKLALQAYNAGPTRLERAHRTGEYDGSNYAKKVLK